MNMTEENKDKESNKEGIQNGIEKLEYLIENHMPNIYKLDEEIEKVKMNLKIYSKQLKDKGLYNYVNSFIKSKIKIMHLIDINISYNALKEIYNIEDFDDIDELDAVEKGIKRNKDLVIKYLNLEKKYYELKFYYPLTKESFEVYNSLNDFEKKYYYYLISIKDSLWDFLNEFENIKSALNKSKDYDVLKTKVVETVFKQKNKYK